MDCNCSVTLPGPSLAGTGTSSLVLFMTVVEHFLRTQCDIDDPCGQITPPAVTFPEYDFIVVGGGSAGAVIASRLSEIPDYKVLLVEKGVNEPTFSQVPYFYLQLQNSSVDWQYYTEPETTACLGTGGSCYWPRGKVIGGSSVLNGMLYVRGNKKDYDNWEQLGNIGWSYKDVLPYFKKSENNLLTKMVDKEFHGVGGRLPVSHFSYEYPIEEDIFEGAKELGLEIGDYNGENQTRFSYGQKTYKNGVRFSSSRAFLRPAKNRPNLHILLNTTVTKVLIDPETKQAYGVELITTEGYLKNVLATKEVVLSAGAINSPQLLLLSGIGDKEELENVDVPVVHHLPGVGRNLQDHVAYSLYFYVNDTCINYSNWALAMEYLLFRTGPLSKTRPSLVGFIKTKYSNNTNDYPDVEILSMFVSDCALSEEIDKNNDNVLKEIEVTRKIMFKPSVFLSKSKGYLTLRNNSPLSYPKIFPRYFSNRNDMDTLIEGIQFIFRLTQTDALKKYGFEFDRTVVGGCEDKTFESDEYWECAIRINTKPEFHPVGTCKMGPDSDSEAVVDPQLRVRGLMGLRVVNSSIIPVIPAANIHAPTVMIAEKASDMIKDEWFNHNRFNEELD